MLFDRVNKLCDINNTNLAKLERECGLANATIRRWNKSSPSADNLKKVADHFGVSVDSLLGREGYDPSESARACAVQFDALPLEKQQLVKVYMSVIQAQ